MISQLVRKMEVVYHHNLIGADHIDRRQIFPFSPEFMDGSHFWPKTAL